MNFVWKQGAHRINKQFLCRPKKLGGFGLPFLENYYIAAQLRTIYAYLASPSRLAWMRIEEFGLSPTSVKEIIWHNKASNVVNPDLNPFLHLTLRVWDKYRTKVIQSPSQATTFLRPALVSPGIFTDNF